MSHHQIDINSDLGESYGVFRIGADAELFPLISSANVACGFHGGDPKTIDATIKAATAQGVRIGAHPSYPDLVGFGRRAMAATPEEIYADHIYQLGAVDGFCRVNGVTMQHVKTHGALNNVAMKNPVTAEAIVAACKAYDPNLRIFVLPKTEMEKAALAAGLPVVREAFADRAYNADATLVARSKPGAMITDPDEAAARMVRLVTEGKITTIDGDDLTLEADTICVHSDTATAVAIATALRNAFDQAGIEVKAIGESMSGLLIAIRELADSTLLVQTGAEPVITAGRAAATNRLARDLIDRNLPGVLDIVPSYTTILIEFDLLRTDIDALTEAIRIDAATIEEGDAAPRRLVTIPVLYGGDEGPDLIEAAGYLGMTPQRLVDLHSSGTYFVAAVGFSPGFGFLLGLPPELTIPRRSTPRVRVPAGSVATAGGQTGVYPMPTPGGWWILGKTPARLFDLRRAEPFALEPGDGVRFAPIDRPAFIEFEAAAAAGDAVLTISEVSA